jgi:outer membrane protein assembly factor BamB
MRFVIAILCGLLLCVPLLNQGWRGVSAYGQTAPQVAQPERGVNDNEKIAEAEAFLTKTGAVFTRDRDGKIIAIQYAETAEFPRDALPHLEALSDLQDLDLGGKHLDNDCIKSIGKLKQLRSLNLFGNPLDSIAMTYLEDLDKLETLYLYRTFIDDEGTKSIAKLKNLKRLNMFDTFLTDVGLKHLGTCKQLSALSIGNTKAGKFPESFFTPAGIAGLRENLPNTNIIYWGEENSRLDKPKILFQAPENDRSTDDRSTDDGSIDRRPAIESRQRSRAIAVPEIVPAPDLSTRQRGSDWPVFLGPSGDGKSTETDIKTDWSKDPPKLRWHRKVGTGFAAPSISNGRLLLYQRVRTRGGEKRFSERISCLQSETGDGLWEVDFPTDYKDLNGYGDGPRSAPVIDGNLVYLLSPEGMLRCLQIVDGKTVWEVDIQKKYKCDFVTYGIGTTPIVYGNRLIVIAGGQTHQHGSFESGIIAVDKRTGVFEYGLGKAAASYASPVIGVHKGRPWCFAFTRDGLTVFNPDSGKPDFEFLWRSNIAGCVNAASPVVADGSVFITEAYGVGGAMLQFAKRAYADQPFTDLWQDLRQNRKKSLASHWATPIYHDGAMYGCGGRHSSQGKLKCVDWKTGNVIWQQKMPDRSSLTYVAGHFLNLGENGVLTLFKATTAGYEVAGVLAKHNAKIVPSYPAWSAPVVARGLMYLRGKQELICYDIGKSH